MKLPPMVHNALLLLKVFPSMVRAAGPEGIRVDALRNPILEKGCSPETFPKIEASLLSAFPQITKHNDRYILRSHLN